MVWPIGALKSLRRSRQPAHSREQPGLCLSCFWTGYANVNTKLWAGQSWCQAVKSQLEDVAPVISSSDLSPTELPSIHHSHIKVPSPPAGWGPGWGPDQGPGRSFNLGPSLRAFGGVAGYSCERKDQAPLSGRSILIAPTVSGRSALAGVALQRRARRAGDAAAGCSSLRSVSFFRLHGLDLQRRSSSGRRVWFKGFFWESARVVYATLNNKRV